MTYWSFRPEAPAFEGIRSRVGKALHYEQKKGTRQQMSRRGFQTARVGRAGVGLRLGPAGLGLRIVMEPRRGEQTPSCVSIALLYFVADATGA
jgi:hypothetical protein